MPIGSIQQSGGCGCGGKTQANPAGILQELMKNLSSEDRVDLRKNMESLSNEDKQSIMNQFKNLNVTGLSSDNIFDSLISIIEKTTNKNSTEIYA